MYKECNIGEVQIAVEYNLETGKIGNDGHILIKPNTILKLSLLFCIYRITLENINHKEVIENQLVLFPMQSH